MYRRSMFPSSPDFVPANLRLYHVSTLGFAPYNFFFRYDVYGKSVAASRALAPVREELLASGNSWHFCSCFRKQRGEKGRGLQVSEGANGELLALLHLPCGSRGERACEDYWHAKGWKIQLLALLLLLEEAEGRRGARTTGIGRGRV